MRAFARRCGPVVSLLGLASCGFFDGTAFAKLRQRGGRGETVTALAMQPGATVTLESSAGYFGPAGASWQTRVRTARLREGRAFAAHTLPNNPRAVVVLAHAPGSDTLTVEIDVEGAIALREVTLTAATTVPAVGP